MKYKAGDYFGELALIDKDMKRKATIRVSSPTIRVVYLSTYAFKRLLGSIETILQRNAESYKKFLK